MKTSYARAAAAIAAALILFTLAPAAAGAPKGKAYTTPEEAVEAFAEAVRKYDLKTLLAIFGEESERLFASEDPTADQNQRQEFLRQYDQKHELVSLDDKYEDPRRRPRLLVDADPAREGRGPAGRSTPRWGSKRSSTAASAATS